MVSSRGHYTVDIVLAFWALAAIGRVRTPHFQLDPPGSFPRWLQLHQAVDGES